MTYRVVVIDDDRERTDALKQQLVPSTPCTIAVMEDLALFESRRDAPPDVVLASMDAVETSPEATLDRIQEQAPDARVLLSHAPDETQRGVRLARSGAYDYLPDDSSSVNDCAEAIQRAICTHRQDVSSHSQAIVRREGNDKLVGTSEAMQEVFDRIGTASKIDMNVVVRGESGTGKELVARTIHAQSDRDEGSLHMVDCTTVSAHDLEEVLFGNHVRSAYDAEPEDDRPGDRTVVLDYVGKLSVDAQAMLNRSLDAQNLRQGAVSPQDHQPQPGVARAIGLTRNHLRDAVQQNEFRKDLYFRLAQFPIQVPPLRERDGDVLQLARHFLDRYVEQCPDLEEATLSADAETVLRSYCWPGNVRELLNVIQRAVYAADPSSARPVIEAEDLMIQPDDPVHTPITSSSSSASEESASKDTDRSEAATRNGSDTTGSRSASSTTPVPADGKDPRQNGVPLGTDDRPILPLEELKRRAVERAYSLCDGDVDHAAVELDIGRSTMYRMLKRYDIRDSE